MKSQIRDLCPILIKGSLEEGEMMMFSERYRDLIESGNGELVDHICGEIPYNVKVKISDAMNDFAEPTILHPNRYDSYEEPTTALHIADNCFNEKIGVPLIRLDQNGFD